MKNKKGISLIVLIITIIIMIILAATIIISLSSNGIIDKAQDAVDKTNEKQVGELASLIWAETYADNVNSSEPKSGEELLEELKTTINTTLKSNNINPEEYNIYVSENGVEVYEKKVVNIPVEITGKGNIICTTAGKGRYNITAYSEEGNILEAGSFVLVNNNEEKRIFLDDATNAVVKIDNIENVTIKAVFVEENELSMMNLETTIRKPVEATDTTDEVTAAITFLMRTNNIKVKDGNLTLDEKVYIKGEEYTFEGISVLLISTSLKGEQELTVDTPKVKKIVVNNVRSATTNFSTIAVNLTINTRLL